MSYLCESKDILGKQSELFVLEKAVLECYPHIENKNLSTKKMDKQHYCHTKRQATSDSTWTRRGSMSGSSLMPVWTPNGLSLR